MSQIKRSKIGNKLKYIFLIIILLFIFTGYDAVIYAASGGNNSQAQNDDVILDPFTLNTVIVVRAEVSNSNVIVTSSSLNDERPPVRIPMRPALRSYYRPSLVPLT